MYKTLFGDGGVGFLFRAEAQRRRESKEKRREEKRREEKRREEKMSRGAS
jgi:hypothetical protein